MARDVLSIARVLGGELVGAGLDAATPVDSAIRLEEFSVIGHPSFATLVVAAAEPLAAALAAGGPRAEALRGTVLVSHGATRALRRAVDLAGVTAIVGTDAGDAVLHPLLVALLATDQAAEDRLVTTGTKVLTQVARRGGVGAVVAELARRIDGWAVLLDPHGQVISTAGAGGLHVQDAVAVAFSRPVRVRHPGLQVHRVGSGEDLSAYLVISSREASMSRGRDLASQAAALLDLMLRTHDRTTTERLGRELMMGTLLDGGPSAAALLRRWGVHEGSLTGFAITARSKSVDLERLVTRWLDEFGSVHLVVEEPGRLLGFLRDDRIDDLVRRVEDVAADARVPLRLGIGSPAASDALARTAAEARQALDLAVTDGRTVAHYRALPTVALVLDRLDAGDGARLAEVLDPLREASGEHGELTRTLRVYLAEHGSWGVAAETLGVHRQTLANRIHRIEASTGLSMGSPDDRTAAWLALRALER
ncbi:purine catabolism regulatory protein [Agromyces sp. CF514]|uniref:PucR family transcriptional regulator n=1 Tax=Agromyces sp. CF514 TaxID=1881031 RepID=UPI0008ECFEF1|nr:helix-turn-helix domain-containing protein [Agromyces sp. CF514]SFR66340.1 purine catabolism regulatory protein [Agromyces sp. CF514]